MEKEATKPKKKVLTEEEKAARMEAARKYTDTLVDKANMRILRRIKLTKSLLQPRLLVLRRL